MSQIFKPAKIAPNLEITKKTVATHYNLINQMP